MKKSTDELLNILKSKRSYNDFLSEEINELYFETLGEYLEIMASKKAMSKSDIIKRANMDRNYAYQLFNGTKKNPSRDKLIMLAFGLALDLNETQKLLKIAKTSELYVRDPRDSAIIFCIEKKMTLIEANEKLDELSLEIIE